MASALAIGSGVAVAAFLVRYLPFYPKSLIYIYRTKMLIIHRNRAAQDLSHGGDPGVALERWAKHSTRAVLSRA